LTRSVRTIACSCLRFTLAELGRCAECVDLFVRDARVSCGGTSEEAAVEFKDRDALLDLGRRIMSGEFDVGAGRLVPPLRTRHVLSNITLFGEKTGHASGYSFLTVSTVGGTEAPRWLASGRYSDRLCRCSAGCWRFESRTFVSDAMSDDARRLSHARG
jgi:hypothetical protein